MLEWVGSAAQRPSGTGELERECVVAARELWEVGDLVEAHHDTVHIHGVANQRQPWLAAQVVGHGCVRLRRARRAHVAEDRHKTCAGAELEDLAAGQHAMSR